MSKNFDVIIIGGGVIGLAAAFHLSKKQIKVLLLEKQYPGAGSTGRCIGGIRQQFSTESSIKLMQESIGQFKNMEREFGFSIEFSQGGYLFLAHSQQTWASYKKVIQIQRELGLIIEELSPAETLKIVPQLSPENLVGAVYSPEDGQACPFKVLKGYIQKIKSHGSTILPDTEVTDILLEKAKIQGVKTSKGDTYFSNIVLNAAGPWAAEIGDLVGLKLPVNPEEHEAFVTNKLESLFHPMIVDYRKDGCYFVQRLNGQIIGCYTPTQKKPGTRTESSLEFLVEMSRRTIRLIPELKKAQVIRQWGGSYSMTPDGSPIIDKTDIKGFYLTIGMSGHGFMFAPAVGRYITQLITENVYPFEWDEFMYNRDFTSKEIMK